MVRRGSTVKLTGIFTMMVLITACASTATRTPPASGLRSTGPAPSIPADVRRIAVNYPRGGVSDWSSAYTRLEGAAFQLKIFRPKLRIIDRSHLLAIVSEQRFQSGGLVSEESAVRIGRMLGVDSVLIYQIDGPSLRDRIFAREQRDLPPVTVTSKIIRVESGEVIYYNVVTERAGDTEGSNWLLTDNIDYQRWSREALDRGVLQTVYDLRRAFE